ncbi:aminopeptidase N [Lapidilactobacillus dextrinicus DSM 20335]|uniref:Aminopeptidase n=1 Tax=Lapidilactobacillus dextrinicus DSM 20335 TaxID=1423738 RepID=A0A0R2BHI0_9LACO|nr:M1 family metallopeptidase [Lapidilactobacillus dextrinicus]KRM78974.1 aminopeptidase N [Lapidilactobacillus dextrinicus DSM 20335]QFG46007.1 M1 family metallopeptidase [Lapidilactobacillus dextrinicus]
MAEMTHFYELFKPEHYDLKININRTKKLITGTSTITGNATQAKVAVHQKFMTIEAVKVADQEVPFELNDDADAIWIDLPKSGDVTMTITYSAPLTDTMMGIYPSYYELNGEKQEIIGTQFEAAAARQAFPCIDEPEAKATFDLAIKYDEKPGETILANMPENRFEDGYHYFDTTMRMSTYLIAFAFGDLQSKQTETKSGVKIGVFTTKAHAMNELDFPLDIAKRAIEFFEDFYQTPYPLPHSWQLALPDFSAGAMENWGLVTYRESYLLFDPDNASMSTKQHVATTVTHELAHQWFGDLVTMKWWDDLWLNESFANMMEYVAVDALEPTWHAWETFQTLEVPRALQRDATDGVQSVHVHVENPAEIAAIFDSAIVYAKGSRMLVMVRSLIGDDALRKGLKNYFAKHHYGNATGADLWQALEDVSGQKIGSIMDSWLEQPGYPVVTAAVVDGQLTLSQKQFFIGEGKDEGRLWQIPLQGNYEETPTIMNEATIQLGDYQTLRQNNSKAFRLNVGNNSHFIVKYDDTLMADLLSEVDSYDAISQLQIIQDMRLLAEGRQISFAEVLPLLRRFANSQSAIVISGLYRLANDLQQFVSADSTEEKNLQTFFGELSAEQVERLGFANRASDTADDLVIRPEVLKAALYAQNKAALAGVHELFVANQANLAALPAEVRALVLTNEVKNFGNAELFDQLLTTYAKSSDASFKADIQVALTSTTDEQFIGQIIVALENADIIKPQDLRAWVPALLNNDASQQATWDWLQSDWSWLEKTVGGGMGFTTYVNAVGQAFKTQARLVEYQQFFGPKINTPGLTREILMDKKVIEAQVDLIESEKAAVNTAVAKEL